MTNQKTQFYIVGSDLDTLDVVNRMHAYMREWKHTQESIEELLQYATVSRLPDMDDFLKYYFAAIHTNGCTDHLVQAADYMQKCTDVFESDHAINWTPVIVAVQDPLEVNKAVAGVRTMAIKSFGAKVIYASNDAKAIARNILAQLGVKQQAPQWRSIYGEDNGKVPSHRY